MLTPPEAHNKLDVLLNRGLIHVCCCLSGSGIGFFEDTLFPRRKKVVRILAVAVAHGGARSWPLVVSVLCFEAK